MKEIRAIAVAIAAFAMVSSACVEEPGGLFVLHNQQLNDECEATPAKEGPAVSRGVLDIALRSRYFMYPLIENQLNSSFDVKVEGQGGGVGDPANFRTETNLVALAGAEVSFLTPANVSFGPQLSQGRFIPVSGAVGPADVATTQLEVLSTEVGRVIRESVEFKRGAGEYEFFDGNMVPLLVTVRFQGETVGGTDVGSNEFSYPLDVCARCLLNYPPGTLFDDTEDAGLTCDTRQAPQDEEGNIQLPDTEDEKVPCLLGQDAGVSCSLCRTLVPDDASADALCDPPDEAN